MLRRTLITGAIAALAVQATAAPLPYKLGPDGATITYTFMLSGQQMMGTVPINNVNLTIDAGNLTASTADVTADVRQARTGLIFATEALKSKNVLAANDFPLARFQSTRVILGRNGRIDNGAVLEGLLTLRGVTRPVRFDAQVFREVGTAVDDLQTLNIMLTGEVNRREFGAIGFPELVDDTVQIEIRAHIETQS